MGFTWFAVDDSVDGHPKVLELESRLRDPNALAYVTRLWCWTHRYAPSGRIPERILPQLERALRWQGEPAGLICALRDVGLLDAAGDDVLVHDWPEHQGSLVEKSKRDAELKRKRRRQNGAKTAPTRREDGAKTAPAPTYLPTNQQDPPTKNIAPASRAPRETDKLLEVFRAVVGEAYVWNGAKDGAAFAHLRKSASLEQILERWHRGLTATGWLQVRNVAQLRAKWNDLADTPEARAAAQAHLGFTPRDIDYARAVTCPVHGTVLAPKFGEEPPACWSCAHPEAKEAS